MSQERFPDENWPLMPEFRSKTLIALGANLRSTAGTPAQSLVFAIKRLSGSLGVIRATSRFFTTPCFPAGAGPDYVNAAIEIDTRLPPAQILAALHQTEADLGRERVQRWGMRTLDLDLVAHGDAVLPDVRTQTGWRDIGLEDQKLRAPDELILPHPRIQDRAFVLVPLADIAPDWCHPVLGRTILQMCRDLPVPDKQAVVPL